MHKWDYPCIFQWSYGSILKVGSSSALVKVSSKLVSSSAFMRVAPNLCHQVHACQQVLQQVVDDLKTLI